jgi:hypothetical protein
VSIDARTPVTRPWQQAHNIDVMAAASPQKPSRYLVRIQAEPGRMIAERMMFCASVRHFLSRNEWTLDMTLDVAEWAGTL